MTNSQGKKVTLATIKSFVRREAARDNLYIKTKTHFDGMVDGVMPNESNFEKAIQTEWSKKHPEHTLGYAGIYLVGSSRDYFKPYADDTYIGYYVSNSCGSFIIAMHR